MYTSCLEISHQLLREFVEEFIVLEYYHSPFPDSPGAWADRYDCQRCELYVEQLFELETVSSHDENCPFRRAHEILEEIDSLEESDVVYPDKWKQR